MRLTQEQIRTIKETAGKYFGEQATVLLFGSRTKDHRRGGDIDLYIETDLKDAKTVVNAEIRFLAELKRHIGDRKIDVLVDYPARRQRPPIFTIARQTGIRL